MDLDSLMPALIFMPWGLFLTASQQENIQNINWQMTDIVPSFQNVFDENVFGRSIGSTADNISLRGKPGFMLSSIHSNIPGFRTGKLWKIILAFFGYLSFLYCSMTSDFTNAKNRTFHLTDYKCCGMSVFLYF